MEDQEYETQFFGFSPKVFADAVYNVKYDYVHNAIRVLHDFLTTQFPNADKQLLMKGSEQLRTQILKSAEKMCDKIEFYVSRNIFVIPEHVLLPEDAVQMDEVVVGTDDHLLDEELLLLESQIRSVKSDLCDHESKKIKLESALQDYESTLNTVHKMDQMQPNGDIEQAMRDMVTLTTDLVETLKDR